MVLGLAAGSPLAAGQDGYERFEGTLTILSGDMTGDEGDLIYILTCSQPAFAFFELALPPEHVPGSLHSGDPVVVYGNRLGDGGDVVVVASIAAATVVMAAAAQPPPAFALEQAVGTAVGVAVAAGGGVQPPAAVGMAAGPPLVPAAGSSGAPAAGSAQARGLLAGGDGPTAAALAAGAASLAANSRVLRDVPVLYMIASICDSGPAISTQAAMSRSNSLVVGPITIPCGFNGSYRFSAATCAYRDAWGWQTYAQQFVANSLAVDISRFRHRVLVLPRGFTYDAGCPWMGLGTLGPVEKGADGSYISSMAWIQGESATNVMALMHELGHNHYLHHANDSYGCEYCDWSSLMGGCCAVRCHNAPHNWQLGWGAPLAVLSSATLPLNTFLYFDLPAQNAAADANILWLQPDWMPYGSRAAANAFPVSYYLSYRIDSGKYDTDMPDTYLYATNVYFWDGPTQTTVRRSRILASVFTDEEYRNAGERWVVRQTAHGVGGGRVGVCRYSEEVETSCGDGQDNDCDGLVDWDDPDCSQPQPALPLPSPPPQARPPPPGKAVRSDDENAEPPGIQEQSSPPPPWTRPRPPHPPSPPPPPSPPSPLFAAAAASAAAAAAVPAVTVASGAATAAASLRLPPPPREVPLPKPQTMPPPADNTATIKRPGKAKSPPPAPPKGRKAPKPPPPSPPPSPAKARGKERRLAFRLSKPVEL
ncbi:Autolysin [Tetrabaena socialis]|uniref:Autolysin n=1 Tax=Tetrabaena socialis TaxID=47790 RepID=A0A2J8A114_9CHLO|nr:Autolysin [Tetrabaena socialis]|eukprot:PNH06210.1 Autolysin [Tetrabaena socialis]